MRGLFIYLITYIANQKEQEEQTQITSAYNLFYYYRYILYNRITNIGVEAKFSAFFNMLEEISKTHASRSKCLSKFL